MNLKVASMNSCICVWRFDVQPVVWILFGWVTDVMQCDDFYAAFLRGTSRPMKRLGFTITTEAWLTSPRIIVVLSRWVVNLVCCFWLSTRTVARSLRSLHYVCVHPYIYKHTPAVDLSIADYRYVKCCVCLSSTPFFLCPVSNFCFSFLVLAPF